MSRLSKKINKEKQLGARRISNQPWWTIFTDGGARPNPGPAGFAVVVYDDDGEKRGELARTLGFKTNNYAEYMGLYVGLKYAKELGAPCIDIRMDSELIVKQILGTNEVRSGDLRPIYNDVMELLNKQWIEPVIETGEIKYRWGIQHIPREENTEADALCTAVILEPPANPFVAKRDRKKKIRKDVDPFKK